MLSTLDDTRRDRIRTELMRRGWFSNHFQSTADATSPSGVVSFDVSADGTCHVDTWGMFDRQSRQSFPSGVGWDVVVEAALAVEADVCVDAERTG